MGFPQPFSFFAGTAESVFLTAAVIGGLIGSLIGGLAAVITSYVFSQRLFKSKVLDNARKDIKGTLSGYMEWLTTVAGEFALWKTDLLPAYVPDSSQDQFELNRMRKLFVDQRNQLWLSKLEEYDTLLEKFNPAIKAMWFRQMELHESFSKVFKSMESDPPEAVAAGEKIEGLAFEQGQLVSDFLYHLQYECLRSVATAKPRTPKDIVKPRIIRTAMGRIRVVTPKSGGFGTL
ncbi:MAG: hypothetical protein JWO30_857 [Fibrobacteres bacterium]|nr:hypothetical protein [Fibrobacterota bacterium]